MNKNLKNSFTYIITTFTQKSITFFLIPVYTYFLTPSQYGSIAVYNSFVALFVVFVSMGLNSAASRFCIRYANDCEKEKEILSTLFRLQSVVVALFVVFFFLLKNQLGQLLLSGVFSDSKYFFVCVTVIMSCFNNIVLSLFQGKRDSSRYSKTSLLLFSANTVLAVTSVVVYRLGDTGILGAQAFANVLVGLYAVWFLFSNYKYKINIASTKQLLVYSLPLVPHAFAGWVFIAFDKMFLNWSISSGIVGVYTLSFSLASLISFFEQSINQAYAPWVINQIDQGNAKVINGISRILVLLYSFLGFAYSLLSDEIVGVISPKNYSDASNVLPLLIFGFVFQGVYLSICNVLFATNTKKIPIASLSGGAVSLFLNAVLIPRFGIYGAALTFLSSNICMSSVVIFLARKEVGKDIQVVPYFAVPFSVFVVSLIPVFYKSALIKYSLFASTLIIIAIYCGTNQKMKSLLYSIWRKV